MLNGSQYDLDKWKTEIDGILKHVSKQAKKSDSRRSFSDFRGDDRCKLGTDSPNRPQTLLYQLVEPYYPAKHTANIPF